MDHTKAVLVLSTDNEGDLVETLFGLGLIPLVRQNMMQALHKIRHERFVAVFLDLDHSRADALEFVLNIRDIDRRIPVIVIGEPDNDCERQVLAKQPETFFVTDKPNQLSMKLKSILMNQPN